MLETEQYRALVWIIGHTKQNSLGAKLKLSEEIIKIKEITFNEKPAALEKLIKYKEIIKY